MTSLHIVMKMISVLHHPRLIVKKNLHYLPKKKVDRYPNGTRIMKQFENGDWYNGTIKKYSKKRGYYSIKFDDGEEEEFDDDDVKQWLKDDDDDEEMGDNDDSSGYETPDDQSTIPQDPGKPRLPSPSEGTTTSGVSN